MPFDGLVGLGFPDVTGEQGLPSDALPIVDQMVKEVNSSAKAFVTVFLIRLQKVLDRNVFSVYMSKDINKSVTLQSQS